MKKKNTPFLNYLLSIGFILLIVIFLSSIVFISRYVLSNVSDPIGIHVKETKNILNDISEVELITKSNNNSINLNLKSKKFFRFNYKNFNISKAFIINLNENKSIFTFYLNGEIGKFKNIYYKKIKSINNLEKGSVIIYNQSKIGYILDIKKDKINILDEETNHIKIINVSLINGIIFLKI